MNKFKFARTGSALLLTTLSGTALASAFQLLEQNASGMGVAYAGSAAVAEDASTVFFNPAGMAFLAPGKSHVALGLDFVQPSAKFSNSASTPPVLIAPGGGNGGDSGGMNYVPHAYFVAPLNERISFGLGLSVPFGLKTEYDPTWVGRFQANKSEVKAINLNPSVSYKLNEQVALGFGLDYQKLDGEFTSAVNFPGAIYSLTHSLPLATMAKEGSAKLSGNDDAWGYNFGVIYQVSPQTRLGLSYRSAIKYHLTGGAAFNYTPIGVPLVDGAIKTLSRDIYADIKLPDTLIASFDHHLNDKWDLLGDLSWTGWGKIPVLQFNYANDNSIVSATQENWKNTWRAALGGIYKYNDNWKLKLGTAYDQSPVPDAYRTARLPDNNRLWLSCGGQYRLEKDGAIDFGYTHIFVRNSSISNNGGDVKKYGLLQGSYKNDVNMLGVQYSRAF
jgi:long-chain fatty acid transport protein